MRDRAHFLGLQPGTDCLGPARQVCLPLPADQPTALTQPHPSLSQGRPLGPLLAPATASTHSGR